MGSGQMGFGAVVILALMKYSALQAWKSLIISILIWHSLLTLQLHLPIHIHWYAGREQYIFEYICLVHFRTMSMIIKVYRVNVAKKSVISTWE